MTFALPRRALAVADGGPPYLVRWDDGHESLSFPGSDSTVEHYPVPGAGD